MLSLFLVGAQAAASPQLPDAPVLWEQMLLAKGGRDKLHDIRIVVMSLRSRGSEFEIVMRPPSTFWWWTKGPGNFGPSIRVWNAPKELFWSESGEKADRTIDLRAKLAMVDWDNHQQIERDVAAFFLETALVQPKPVAVRRASTTTAYLEVSLPRLKNATYTVDLKTADVMAFHWTETSQTPTIDSNTAPRRYDFQGRRVVNGIQLPTRVRWSSSWQEATFQINPNVDPRMFETAPVGVTSRDDWRKWLRP